MTLRSGSFLLLRSPSPTDGLAKGKYRLCYSCGSQGKNTWVSFPSPVDHILSEPSTMTHPSWVALHGLAHSFREKTNKQKQNNNNNNNKTHLFLLYWLCQSLWLCGSQQTGKFLKRWVYQTTLLASWETFMQDKKQQLELDMKQPTGSKLRKEYVKAVYCYPDYLTCMQSTSWETLDWMKHKLESRLLGEEPLDESERGDWKSWLKTQY